MGGDRRACSQDDCSKNEEREALGDPSNEEEYRGGRVPKKGKDEHGPATVPVTHCSHKTSHKKGEQAEQCECERELRLAVSGRRKARHISLGVAAVALVDDQVDRHGHGQEKHHDITRGSGGHGKCYNGESLALLLEVSDNRETSPMLGGHVVFVSTLAFADDGRLHLVLVGDGFHIRLLHAIDLMVAVLKVSFVVGDDGFWGHG
mmetsp:Transcript_22117/g.39232  ORF Transcript_22117/g.39232 Transcript_22117/m.39232 type:complete len:205 (+) Transcript_22117:1709-2323(+)